MRRTIALLLTIIFTLTNALTPVCAQMIMPPTPAASPQEAFAPLLLRGINVSPQDPFVIDFVIDPGNSQINKDALEKEILTQVRYFLAALTIPEEDLWVNLSPYEKDRIIPDRLGLTDLGRELLREDATLKQVTAAFMHPDSGKGFWQAMYAALYDKYGTTDIPLDTFNKVWISPGKAAVHAGDRGTFITASSLRVMLESDRLAMLPQNAAAPVQTSNEILEMARSVMRQTIIPELEKTVNSGRDFAPLRQIYHAVILATWYKQTLRNNIINKIYSGKQLIKGIDTGDPDAAERIYSAYIDAFKQGACDIIREENDPFSGETIARRYFTGGANLRLSAIDTGTADEAQSAFSGKPPLIAQVEFDRDKASLYKNLIEWYRDGDPDKAWFDITDLVTMDGKLPKSFPFRDGMPINFVMPLCNKRERAGISRFLAAPIGDNGLKIYMMDKKGNLIDGNITTLTKAGDHFNYAIIRNKNLPKPESVSHKRGWPKGKPRKPADPSNELTKNEPQARMPFEETPDPGIQTPVTTSAQETLLESILDEIDKRTLPVNIDPFDLFDHISKLAAALSAGKWPEMLGAIAADDPTAATAREDPSHPDNIKRIVDQFLKYHTAVRQQGYDITDAQINDLFFNNRILLSTLRRLQRTYNLYSNTNEIILTAEASSSYEELEARLADQYNKTDEINQLKGLQNETRDTLAPPVPSEKRIIEIQNMVYMLEWLRVPGNAYGEHLEGKLMRRKLGAPNEYRFTLDPKLNIRDWTLPGQTILINKIPWVIQQSYYQRNNKYNENEQGPLLTLDLLLPPEYSDREINTQRLQSAKLQPYLDFQKEQELVFLKQLLSDLEVAKKLGTPQPKNVMINQLLNLAPHRRVSADDPGITLINKALEGDLTKLAAIKRALRYPLNMLKGFAGSGKTTATVELVEQQMRKNPNSRILYVSQMHQAVDVFTRKLPGYIQTLRIGNNPDKMHQQSLRFSQHDQEHLTEFQETLRTNPNAGYVITGTTTGAAAFNAQGIKTYDLIIHDEGSRDNFVGVLKNLRFLKPDGNFVLIGDGKQLPPFGLSENEKRFLMRRGVDKNMERWIRLYEMNAMSFFEKNIFNGPVTSLRKNYRQIPVLARLVSALFYENRMLARGAEDYSPDALVLHQIKGQENRDNPTRSTMNSHNLAKVKEILLDLKARNTPAADITIMTLYEKERAHLASLVSEIFPGVTIKGKDDIDNMTEVNGISQATTTNINGYQGGENKIVILDLVLSNEEGNTRFATANQILVALSRAQTQLHVVGDLETFAKSKTPGIGRIFTNLKQFWQTNFFELFDLKDLPKSQQMPDMDTTRASLQEPVTDEAMINGGIDLKTTLDMSQDSGEIPVWGINGDTTRIEGLNPRLIRITPTTVSGLFPVAVR